MARMGRCHCGAVTFSVEGEPIRMAQCHCNACRRMSGTGHATWAFFPSKGLRVSGAVSVYQSPADSGATKLRSFCPRCGSPLFTQKHTTPERVGIAAGAFDESSWFIPEEIVYPWERPDWDTIDPAIPQQKRPSQ